MKSQTKEDLIDDKVNCNSVNNNEIKLINKDYHFQNQILTLYQLKMKFWKKLDMGHFAKYIV